MKYLLLLSTVLFLFSCSDGAEFQEKINALEADLAAANSKLAATETQLAEMASPGMTHSVFFWLKEDLSEEAESSFLDGLNSLRKVSTVKNLLIGPPAATEERGVVDNTFSYALLVDFENEAGEAAYQIDPIHLKFIEDHKDKWTRVVVYDSMNQH